MTCTRTLVTLFLTLTLAPACDDGSDDPSDSMGGEDTADEGTTSDGGDSGASDGGAGSSGTPADSGNSDDSDDSDDSTSMECDGSWILGSVPFTGESFIERCDANPPTTCITGNYIVFDDGDCFCLPECSQAGLSEGDACTNDGQVTCTRIENDSGNSSGVFCVPPEWGLCG